MRILGVHNYYQIRGGEDECFEAENRLLQDMGHHVDVYMDNNHHIETLGKVETACRTIWSTATYRAVKQQLHQADYDVMHVRNFFPLISPSVYYAAKTANVPVVQTLSNYRMLCPNALFFREGRVCEDCLGHLPVAGVVHGCYRNSHVASLGAATMLGIHSTLRTWTSMVDIYIALTEFARQKFIEGGFPAEKIVVNPNFVPDPGVGDGSGDYAIFVGRLSVEKGIQCLLTAWKSLGNHIPLKIAGDGPLTPDVEEAIAAGANIEWLGRQSMDEIFNLLKAAKFLVFPSVWYEGLPRTIIESYATGTPIVASNLGSMSGLISHSETGLHVRPNDPDDLVAQVEWLLAHPQQLQAMRRAARAKFEAEFTADANYKRLLAIYELANS